MANDEFDLLRNGPVPTPRDSARERALEAALSAYDLQNTSAATQGTASGHRLTERAWRLWSEMMNKKMYATPAIAGLLALPIAGYTTYYLMKDSPFAFEPDTKIGETADKQGEPVDRERTEDPTVTKPVAVEPLKKKADADEGEIGRDVTTDLLARQDAPAEAPKTEATVAPEQDVTVSRNVAAPEPMVAPSTVAPGEVAGLVAGGD